MALTLARVDLKEGIIEIPEEITKTGEAQTLPLSDELINMLKKQFRQDDAEVFDTTNFRKEFQQGMRCGGTRQDHQNGFGERLQMGKIRRRDSSRLSAVGHP